MQCILVVLHGSSSVQLCVNPCVFKDNVTKGGNLY